MTKKTAFTYPTEKYLNIVKRGYKDCKLNSKYLKHALKGQLKNNYFSKIFLLKLDSLKHTEFNKPKKRYLFFLYSASEIK